MKIVILDGYVANPGDLDWSPVADCGNLAVYPRTAPEDVVSRCEGAEAVFVNKVLMTSDVLDRLPALKFIGVLATGYNNIDIAAARERGITVCNVPGYSTDAVAQQVFALLLALTNRIESYDTTVKRLDWSNCEDFSYTLGPITELAGLTMGIFGLGNIGRRVAAIAYTFGMNVVSPTSARLEDIPPYVTKVSFEEMCRQADVISINAPLSDRNRGIFNAQAFEMMKPSAILLNTARGPIVNEHDLATALRNGIIAGAGLDVLAVEPPAADNPLFADDIARRVVITPHIAWQSTAARRRLIAISASNLKSFIDGKPVNVVS